MGKNLTNAAPGVLAGNKGEEEEEDDEKEVWQVPL